MRKFVNELRYLPFRLPLIILLRQLVINKSNNCASAVRNVRYGGKRARRRTIVLRLVHIRAIRLAYNPPGLSASCFVELRINH